MFSFASGSLCRFRVRPCYMNQMPAQLLFPGNAYIHTYTMRFRNSILLFVRSVAAIALSQQYQQPFDQVQILSEDNTQHPIQANGGKFLFQFYLYRKLLLMLNQRSQITLIAARHQLSTRSELRTAMRHRVLSRKEKSIPLR